MTEPVITGVTITYAQGLWDLSIPNGSAQAELVFSDRTTGVFTWFHDEVSFAELDFIDRTMAEVREIYRQRDLAWLRS